MAPLKVCREHALLKNTVKLVKTTVVRRTQRHVECRCCQVDAASQARKVLGRRQTLQLGFASLMVNIPVVALPPNIEAVDVAGSPGRQGIGRYIKKKSLDPLESYVPAVVAARNQLTRAGALMKDDLQEARQMLRVGAFDGLRDNIRALGEYAERDGQKNSKQLVDGFFLAVQNFDFTLFQAKRNQQPVKEDSDAALENAVAALNKLLATVPKSILEQAEKIVAAVENSSRSQPAAPKQDSDQQMNQLMQLVPS